MLDYDQQHALTLLDRSLEGYHIYVKACLGVICDGSHCESHGVAGEALDTHVSVHIAGDSDVVVETAFGADGAGDDVVCVDAASLRRDANRAKREKSKRRRLRKRAASSKGVDSGVDLPSGEDSSVDLSVPEWRRGGVAKPVGWQGSGSGFWNSCDDLVRRRLIESKARMHIAENERKAAEARSRVEYLESPRAVADQVVKLASQLEKQTGIAQSNAIAGWAQTVISHSAESIAKSAPSSAPSFDTYITERSEREARRVEELKCEMEKLAADAEEAERVEAQRKVDADREVKRLVREEMQQQVDSRVQAQIKTKIAEFEREFRLKNVVMPKDMRTRAVEDFPLRSHQLAGYVRRQN